jgi:O-antigen ligase
LVDTSSETVGGEILHRFGNDPQQLGLQIVWALGFLLILAFAKARTWRSTCVWMAVLLATLALTLSRTAIVAAAAVMAVVTWVHSTGRQRIMAIACACLLIGAALLALAGGLLAPNSDAVASTASRSGDLDELRTFTGRVEIWKYSWRKCLESPLVGYGYGGSRYVLQEDPDYPLKFQANHAHNLFLNMALTTGLPGALLLATMFAQLLLMNLRRPSPVPSLALTLVITASITESLLYSSMPRSHMILWLVALFWQQMGMDVDQRDSEFNSGEM